MSLSWLKKINYLHPRSLLERISVYKWPNSIKVNCSNVASHLPSHSIVDLKNSGFEQGGKSVWVIFSTDLSDCLQTCLDGFSWALHLWQHRHSAAANQDWLSTWLQAVSYAPSPTMLFSLLCCTGYVGGIPSAAVLWLNSHSFLFQMRPGTWARLL